MIMEMQHVCSYGDVGVVEMQHGCSYGDVGVCRDAAWVWLWRCMSMVMKMWVF